MKKLIIKTDHLRYPVLIGHSVISRLPELLKNNKLVNNIYVLIDKNVAEFHLGKIKSTFSNKCSRIHYRVLTPGEKSKSDFWLKKIYSELINNNFGRDTTLVAVGGGVTGDIAGYAAATYMRGIPLVQVPTTLLAMIDSSIGGKTGINFNGKKNIIGAFYQPKFVFVDTSFLSTLPNRELNSASGELLKYGLISNENFYNFLYTNINKISSLNYNIIKKAIIECISIKGSVVAYDEFESRGIRKILNVGHTFAHAIESTLDFKIKHGEAVVAGIICALYLSYNLGILNSTKLKKLLELPCSIHLPKIIKTPNNNQIFNEMFSDKKNREAIILFVLVSDIGKMLVDVPADKEAILLALNKMKEAILV